jgi:RNA recognition motif-containing protein
MDIFVGNLPYKATEDDVKKLFEGFGNVASVVIVMQKGKKTPKSRGFGFVQMADEQTALAAITALNGKEFMSRALDVTPAHPKAEARNENEVKEKRQPEITPEAKQRPREEREQKKPWVNPSVRRPGPRNVGRRSLSYMKRRGGAGMPEEARPWKRSGGESKPWRKSEGGSKPWAKPARDAEPWKKPAGDTKPWKKPAGETRPWKKAEGEFKPWHKSKPWEKPAGAAKPWSKRTERPQKSRFKGSKNH